VSLSPVHPRSGCMTPWIPIKNRSSSAVRRQLNEKWKGRRNGTQNVINERVRHARRAHDPDSMHASMQPANPPKGANRPSGHRRHESARSGAAFVLGATLVALSVVEKGTADISLVFAIGGVLLLALSLYSQQLISLEIGARGAKAVLREVREIADEEDLTVEEKADVIFEVLDSIPTEPASRSESARSRSERFELSARQHLVEAGWTPNDAYEGPRDFGFDFVGQRDGQTVVAEFKARTRMSSADLARSLEQLERSAKVLDIDESTASLILVVPAGSITSGARAFSAVLRQENPRFDVLEIGFDF
jgi:hypothetical protein